MVAAIISGNNGFRANNGFAQAAVMDFVEASGY
jgi:hypothetical protein